MDRDVVNKTLEYLLVAMFGGALISILEGRPLEQTQHWYLGGVVFALIENSYTYVKTITCFPELK